MKLPEAIEQRLHALLPMIPGWCTPEKAVRLAELVCEAQATSPVSVELGVFGGRGLLALQYGHVLRGGYHAIGVDAYTAGAALQGTNDPANDEWWGKQDLDRVYVDALKILTLTFGEHTCRPQLWRMDSFTAARFVEDGLLSVLHQDSNHSPEVSCAEIDTWLPKMAPAGRWVMDDADWPSLQPAQLKMRAMGWEVLEDHTKWLVWGKPE